MFNEMAYLDRGRRDDSYGSYQPRHPDASIGDLFEGVVDLGYNIFIGGPINIVRRRIAVQFLRVEAFHVRRQLGAASAADVRAKFRAGVAQIMADKDPGAVFEEVRLKTKATIIAEAAKPAAAAEPQAAAAEAETDEDLYFDMDPIPEATFEPEVVILDPIEMPNDQRFGDRRPIKVIPAGTAPVGAAEAVVYEGFAAVMVTADGQRTVARLGHAEAHILADDLMEVSDLIESFEEPYRT